MAEIVIETKNLAKVFKRDEFQVTALKNCRHRDPKGRVRRADGTVGLGKIHPAALDRRDGSPHATARLPCSAKICAL